MIGTKSSDIAFVLLRKNVENLAYSKQCFTQELWLNVRCEEKFLTKTERLVHLK